MKTGRVNLSEFHPMCPLNIQSWLTNRNHLEVKIQFAGKSINYCSTKKRATLIADKDTVNVERAQD
jgi:hypothetical protein